MADKRSHLIRIDDKVSAAIQRRQKAGETSNAVLRRILGLEKHPTRQQARRRR